MTWNAVNVTICSGFLYITLVNLLKMCGFIFLYIALCFGSIFAAKLPSFIKPCSISDLNLDQCIEEVIRTGGPLFAKGIPDLEIDSLDPVNVGTVIINNPSLKINFTNTIVTGLSNFRLNSHRINLDKGKATLDFTANVTKNAHYTIDGQVLILSLKGEGESTIKLRNLNIVIKYNLKNVDGYWTMLDYQRSYKVEHVHFNFTNLFGANKELADVAHQFINDNWSDIIYEIAPPALHQIIEHCVNNVKKLFSIFPISELLVQ